MLNVGKGVFVQIPGEEATGQRLLHPAKIVAAGDGLYTAEFEETDIALKSGMDVTLFYEIRGEFSQQPARIDVVMDDGRDAPDQAAGDGRARAPLVGFQTLDQPITAESRRFYRVSTITTGLAARVGQEDCPIIDISAAGLAVTGSGAWSLADRLPVLIRSGSSVHAGLAMVQSVRTLRDGRVRYGLLCVEEKGSTLRTGLERVGATVQRQQIRRLMGAG
jgi:hypothetical protein